MSTHNFTKTPLAVDSLEKSIRDSTITAAIDSITSLGTALTVSFKAALSVDEETILGNLVTAHDGVPLSQNAIQTVNIDSQKTSTGLTKVAIYEPEGGAATLVTHNFADKCSWYQGAIQMIADPLISTDLVYSSSIGKTHWIDLEHGRIYDEDNIMLLSGSTYKVKVYVDAVLITTGYSIDYVAGTITFESAPSGVVTCSYWYADKSWFRVRPKVGKVLMIKTAEVQFSHGTLLNTSGAFVFCPWFVGHPVYGTMEIPGQRTVYKNAKDFISACNEGQGFIPKWAELTDDVHVFPFHYARPKPIKYSDFIEIRVYCANHEPVSGEYATATFYVVIDNEV